MQWYRALPSLVWVCAFPLPALCFLAPLVGAGEQTDPSVPPPASAREMEVGQSRLRLYGFARLDGILDDSRPDSFQSPLFILSEDPRSTPKDQANFSLHPRLTRLGLDFSGPKVASLGDAALSGRIEADFQNGGRESRAIPRYRHVFLKLAWHNASLLAGQTADVLSPLFPTANNDTLMWNAGNLGDRRAQVRFAYEPGNEGIRTSWAAALGLTGAVDAQDLDGDGARDGEAAATPHLQARFGISFPTGAPDRRFEAGISGHLAKEETSRPVAGETEFDSRSLGIDFQLPLAARLMVQGEVWRGKNLSDFRGGIAQDVGPSGQEVQSQGGWLELGVPGPRYSVYAGITRDDPRDEDIPPQGRTRNGARYLVQRFKPAKAFTVGLDYLNWTTEYRDLADGRDHRFNLYLIYDF